MIQNSLINLANIWLLETARNLASPEPVRYAAKTMKRQYIIIDKNIFQRRSALQDLAELAEGHTIIIPHILLEECLTTESAPGPRELLEKAEALVKAGAVVSLSQGRMLDIEKESLQPLRSVIDETVTELFRNNTIRDVRIDIEKEAKECAKCFEPIIHFVEK